RGVHLQRRAGRPSETVGAGELAVHVVEAVVFEIDHDDVLEPSQRWIAVASWIGDARGAERVRFGYAVRVARPKPHERGDEGGRNALPQETSHESSEVKCGLPGKRLHTRARRSREPEFPAAAA